MDFQTMFLGFSIVATGLMAGLWYGWSVSVIPGTRRVDDVNYIHTMQQINRAIINPGFIVPFVGIPLLVVAAAVLQFRAGDVRRGWLLVGSAAAYLVGVLGVTAGRNVPLNDSLDSLDLDGSDSDAVRIRREAYEAPWNRWHYVRTGANLVSFVLASTAALVSAESD